MYSDKSKKNYEKPAKRSKVFKDSDYWRYVMD